MKVFVITGHIEHESGEALSVCSTIEKAEAEKDRLKSWGMFDWIEINEMELDNETDTKP